MTDNPKQTPSNGKTKKILAKLTRVFVGLILVVGGVFAILILSDDSSNKLIDGKSMETYKVSVSNIHDKLSGEKLKKFDDAIAVLDFVLKDSAYIEAGGKTANEIIESSEGIKELYVNAANLGVLEKYSQLIKKWKDFLNNYNLTIKSFNLMADEWTLKAESIKCTEDDLIKTKSLLEKIQTVDEFEIRYGKTENMKIDAPINAVTFEDAKKTGDKNHVYNELIAVLDKQFSSLDKDALLIQDVRDEVKTICTE